MAELRGGVDLGGTKIEALVVGADNRILAQARAATPQDGGPAAVAAAIAHAVIEAAGDAKIDPSDLLGVGVGSPGGIDEKTGVVSSAQNLPDWDGAYPLGEVLSKRLGTKVKLGNDVDVATEAEYRLGAGVGYEHVLGVFWGTGVGSGLILNGERFTGRGYAGEFGHMVIKAGGRPEVGRPLRGTVEAYAGRAAMTERARKLKKRGRKTRLFKIMKAKGKDRLTSSVWARALKEKDGVAVELIDEAVWALGVGIAAANNLLDLEAVIVGGGIGTRLGKAYVDRIATEMQPHLFTPRRSPRLKLASLGDAGGALGAALLVR